jgi:hypothetical protein
VNLSLLAAEAGRAYLVAQNFATVTNFYAEVEDPDAHENDPAVRDLPCVICTFSQGTEYPMGTGNYSGTLEFRMESSADDQTSAEFLAMFDEVWAKISTDTILADLSAAGTNFTAFGFTSGIEQSALKIENRIRTKSISLPINCCPSDVS